MQDPYHEVQSEIQSSLQNAINLRSSYQRIKSTAGADSEELAWARNELNATLTTLEADLEDLEGSVKMVEETGARMFGLEEDEVMRRRKYVAQVKREIDNMKRELTSDSSHRQADKPTPRNDAAESRTDEEEWAEQEQQMMIHQQDRTLTDIQGTLTTLAQQAGLMGTEISEHVEMLDDLERNVDRTDSKLNTAMKKLQKFIRDTEETKSGWCIGILIVILCVLLLMVVLI
ncbi:hypothetical protein SISSUDRAFT_1026629 [Sistotremastrum suecicum HHB10207 ss-3]|uniref:t-SNARE coiled-coil homology domain-containing protein n=1 Tax=Sistotremastrum suecicum HHB10207 ss-3 TaxID=1314776 RepID=A0A165ZKQ4_9AGAM|nr:hypothetical protein SISSUDRAFT_1026629 [Sistotremastrum suecicum HHB10207 ss-3]